VHQGWNPDSSAVAGLQFGIAALSSQLWPIVHRCGTSTLPNQGVAEGDARDFKPAMGSGLLIDPSAEIVRSGQVTPLPRLLTSLVTQTDVLKLRPATIDHQVRSGDVAAFT
jgi:hypothetical protein